MAKRTPAFKAQKVKMSAGDYVFAIIDYLVFGIFTAACIFPFYYLIINTISNNKLVAAHKKFWYRFVIVTMYLNAGIIPWYLNMSMLGLTNNYLAYILPGIMVPYNLILVKTYIESIPPSLEESAQLDGAGYWQRFSKIILPLSKPILATIAIFGAVNNWNSFQDSLILMQGAPKLYTLQHRLYIYLNQSSNLSSLMSGSGSVSSSAVENLSNMKVIKYTVATVSVIPILAFYPFMQRYFEGGIMLGAVKG